MNREMLEMVEVLAQEKNVPREVVFGVLETALSSAVKKANFAGEDADIEVHVDREITEPGVVGSLWLTIRVCRNPTVRKCTPIFMTNIRN